MARRRSVDRTNCSLSAQLSRGARLTRRLQLPLRARRARARTAAPETLGSEGTLSAADVSVLYVDLQDGDAEAHVVELRLDDNGYFLDEWPHGFFDERLDELFGSDQ
jgi:hypothetical protein